MTWLHEYVVTQLRDAILDLLKKRYACAEMVKPPKKLKINLVRLCCVNRVKILNGSVWMKFLAGGNAPLKRIEFFFSHR